jgi:hypothetical protein
LKSFANLFASLMCRTSVATRVPGHTVCKRPLSTINHILLGEGDFAMATRTHDADRDENRDPITGEHGAHPVGAGVGAAVGGAVAGAAAGMAAGPVGTVAGAVVGGLAGGLAGKEIAEQVDPTAEEHYWRNEYASRDYYDPEVGYNEVGPAYQYGWESRAEYGDRKWDEVEQDLARKWPEQRGKSTLEWGRARPATRDAWERVDKNFAANPQNRTYPDPMEDRGVAGAPQTPK